MTTFKALQLVEKVNAIIQEIIAHTPDIVTRENWGEHIVSQKDLIMSAFEKVIVPLLDKLNKIADSIDNYFDDEDYHSIYKIIKILGQSLDLMITSYKENRRIFNEEIRYLIAQDDKRWFFKKVSQDSRDGMNTLISLFDLYIDGMEMNKYAIDVVVLSDLPSKLDELLKHSNQTRKNELARQTESLESARSRGQAQGMIDLFKAQMSLLIEHKKNGLDIERETYEMRRKLLELERQENNAMVQDLLKTLDSL